MTASTTFSGFSPEHPQGRDFSLWNRVPAKNRGEDTTQDLRRFINCLQEIVDLLLIDVDEFTDLYDPDLCSDSVIDAMLQDIGNPFDWAELDLTTTQLRKLLRLLVPIYQSKGTKQGIENAVLFLLGEDVTVVPYLSEGWTLGVDMLGEGDIAQLQNYFISPYSFAFIPQPWTLSFSIDEGPDQFVTFVPGDFVSTMAGTIEEVQTVIESQLSGIGTYIINDGEPAALHGSAGPYNLVGGEVFILIVDVYTYEIHFRSNDFDTPGAATLAEVLKVFEAHKIPGIGVGVEPISGGLIIATLLRGSDAFIRSSPDSANTASTRLSIAKGAVGVGLDGKRMYIYSQKVGTEASVECTSPSAWAALLLGFWGDVVSGTGSAILAPSESYTLYSFDIETQTSVDAETESLIRKIAEYMKVAHEHLINIRTALPLPWPEGWQIGVDELDVDTELTE